MILLLKKIKRKIYSFFKRTVTPPSYEYKRAQISNCKQNFGINTLVETGTFLGDTVEFFKSRFKNVISIELADKLAADAKKRFENDSNVTIIHGDSGEILKDIVAENNGRVLFWLDGHYSSEFFMGDVFVSTAKGKKNTPVQEELQLIMGSDIDHVVMIDDARLFTGQNDYPTIKQVKQLVKSCKANYRVTVNNDIIYILPHLP